MQIFVALYLFTSLGVGQDNPFPSGPQVGDKLPAFQSLAFSGPDAGKEINVVAKIKDKPGLLIFVHQITRPGLLFLRPVAESATARGGGP